MYRRNAGPRALFGKETARYKKVWNATTHDNRSHGHVLVNEQQKMHNEQKLGRQVYLHGIRVNHYPGSMVWPHDLIAGVRVWSRTRVRHHRLCAGVSCIEHAGGTHLCGSGA